MRRLAVAALAVSTISCSMLPGGLRPSAGDVLDGARTASEIADQKKRCDAFSDLQVPYAEETSIGGAMALSLAKNTKTGVFVELSPEVKDLPAINPTDWKYKKPAPGRGERTELNHYLNLVGKNLAAFSERPTIDWTFMVLDSDAPNAFSAPGGYVFVTTGLLKLIDNEAQLAGILGHEIGHVAGRHALESYKKSKQYACYCAYFGGKLAGAGGSAIRNALGSAANDLHGLDFASEVIDRVSSSTAFNPDALGGKFIATLADRAGDTIVKAGFDSSYERDADATSTKLLIFAGYDAGEFEKVLAKLPDGSFFSPHPPTADRVAVIKKTRAEYEGFGAGKTPALGPSLKILK